MSVVSTMPPERTAQQRLDAIARANEIRLGRAQTKRDLKAVRVSIHDLLDSPPEHMAGARVEETAAVIRLHHRHGKLTAGEHGPEIRAAAKAFNDRAIENYEAIATKREQQASEERTTP